MHCKTLRSEYMKRFKDPEWEAYRSCYEEMLKYRLSRRILEHSHNPWLWNGWDGSSGSSSGHSTPLTKPYEPKAPEPGQPSHNLAHAGHQEDTESTPCPAAASDPLIQENNQDGEKNTESNEKSASHSRAQYSHSVPSKQSFHKIHESALRAKNRRQKERKKHLLQKQRARSADSERVLRRKPSPVDNPWMTEYMRCYSARAR
ncbi:centriole, cilia and spindle-associated protein isoform X2 [Phyllobates terribilis]|uniref:centriole, cilia and spindle-associated protein isoform X2 n=1 Tax=Phyllobates terribilis TaxID=111132 RepID=UPI003CCA9796